MADPTRATVSQPGPDGLSDEELLELMPQQFRDDLATVSRMAAHGAGSDVGPGLFRVSLNTGALEFARAAIAADRAQRQPVPDGEVQEVVKWLRSRAGIPASPDFPAVAAYLTRAADLLERLSPPQPVPVSERLPEEPLAWWFTPEGDEDYGWWVLEPDGMERCPQPTHWLPAHALPVPAND